MSCADAQSLRDGSREVYILRCESVDMAAWHKQIVSFVLRAKSYQSQTEGGVWRRKLHSPNATLRPAQYGSLGPTPVFPARRRRGLLPYPHRPVVAA